MRSALGARLSQADKQELVTYAKQRLENIRSQREGTEWYAEREKFERIAAANFDHRLSGQPDAQNIYDRGGNASLQIVRSVRRFMLARECKDLFGSSPWFAVKPQGPMDQALAEQIHKHAGWKLDQASYEQKAKEAIGVALDLGECAMMTTWKVEEDAYETISNILVGPDAKPVLDQDGDYFYETDDAVEVGESETEPGMMTEEQEPSDTPDMTEGPSAPRVFVKDPSVPVPSPGNGYTWQEHLVEEKVRLYSGLHVAPLYWKDVFWDQNAADIQESDFIAREYDASLEELSARFNPDGDNAEVAAMLALAKEQGPGPKAKAGQAKPEQGESWTCSAWDDYGPIKVTEIYMKRMVGGRMTRVWMVMDIEQEICIWVDYLAAISPRSKYPIHLVTVNRVSGRAYGRGFYKVFEMAADTIDKLVNGILYRNSYNSDPVKVFNKSNVEGFETNPNLVVGPGSVIVPKNIQTKASDILQIVVFPDLDERTWQLVELFMQLIQVESGVTNANQGDISDLPQNTTATGINSMLESSSVLHHFVLGELKDSLSPQLTYAIELLYMKQDEDETYEYLEGQASGVMALADAEQLRKLPMNVEILLSRAKRQEMREAALAAIPWVERFTQTIATDPEGAKRIRKLYIQALRGLEIDDADTILPNADEIDQRVIAMQQQMAAQQAQETEGEQPAEEAQTLPDNVIPAQAA